jgi:hypothetical protein
LRARPVQQHAVLAGWRFGRPEHGLDAAQRELVLAHHLEQRLGILEAQLVGQRV